MVNKLLFINLEDNFQLLNTLTRALEKRVRAWEQDFQSPCLHKYTKNSPPGFLIRRLVTVKDPTTLDELDIRDSWDDRRLWLGKHTLTRDNICWDSFDFFFTFVLFWDKIWKLNVHSNLEIIKLHNLIYVFIPQNKCYISFKKILVLILLFNLLLS